MLPSSAREEGARRTGPPHYVRLTLAQLDEIALSTFNLAARRAGMIAAPTPAAAATTVTTIKLPVGIESSVMPWSDHHVSDLRKHALYGEVAELLRPGGVFCNLDLVASPTQVLHDKWREEMGVVDDPSDILCDLQSQLRWLSAVGLRDVDCIWKWRSLALLRGQKPLHAKVLE